MGSKLSTLLSKIQLKKPAAFSVGGEEEESSSTGGSEDEASTNDDGSSEESGSSSPPSANGREKNVKSDTQRNGAPRKRQEITGSEEREKPITKDEQATTKLSTNYKASDRRRHVNDNKPRKTTEAGNNAASRRHCRRHTSDTMSQGVAQERVASWIISCHQTQTSLVSAAAAPRQKAVSAVNTGGAGRGGRRRRPRRRKQHLRRFNQVDGGGAGGPRGIIVYKDGKEKGNEKVRVLGSSS